MDLAIGGGLPKMPGAGGLDGIGGAGQAAKPPVPEVSGNDAERFNAAMNSEAQPVDSVANQSLKSLADLSADVQADRSKAMDVLGKPGVSQAELIGAQFALMESANTIAAVSKVAEKITSAVKTLQQG
jgi:hypothetical protein